MSREPGLPLLVFDGDCGFCTTWADRGERWLRLDHVEPWQHLDLEALGLTREQCERAVQWVDGAGIAHEAQWAIIAALRHRGGPWGAFGRVLAVPGISHAAGWAYHLVARYRDKLPGSTPACQIGRPE